MDGIILRPGDGDMLSCAGEPTRLLLEAAGLGLVETAIPAALPDAGPPDPAAVAEVYRRHNSELAH